jgi:hypothetical protein
MHIQENLYQYSRAFKLGILLAILEYDGYFELQIQKEHLPLHISTFLPLLPAAIYRSFIYGDKDKIEPLVLDIGDIPHDLDVHQQKEFVDGYMTECVLQTPFPGFIPRHCTPYRATRREI